MQEGLDVTHYSETVLQGLKLCFWSFSCSCGIFLMMEDNYMKKIKVKTALLSIPLFKSIFVR